MSVEAVRRGVPAFIGRERELELCDAMLAEARIGRGQLLLLAGEPGIGKTRLASECAARAEASGMRVLWGRAWEGDGAPAFWPWMQIVRAYLGDADHDTLSADLGRAGAEIARAMPEVEGLLPEDCRRLAGASLGLLPEQDRFRFFDGLTQFLKAASRRRPMLLVLDDLQWADTPSLLLWQFLAQDLADSRLVVIGTYRESELTPDHPLFLVLGAVRRGSACRLLPVTGLRSDEIERYVATLSDRHPSTELVATLAERTEGNPLYLRELVHLLLAEGTIEDVRRWKQAIPSGIRQVIGRRRVRLSARCDRLLILASALGQEFSIEILNAVAVTEDVTADLRETLTTLQEAVAVGLVQENGGDSYTFSHAMIREALYAELAAASVRSLHRRIGEALEESDAVAQLSELAHHFGIAGVKDKACSYFRQAGDHALSALAYEDAALMYQRALDLLSDDSHAYGRVRCELLLVLEESLMRAGDMDSARSCCFEAAALARSIDDCGLFARAALGSGWPFDAGVVDDARIALLRDALEGLDAADSPLRARLTARLAVALYFAPDSYEVRADLSAEAVAMARRLADPVTLAFTLNTRLYALWVVDDIAERLLLASELLGLAETRGDSEMALQSRHWLVMDLMASGQIELARRHIAVHAALAVQQRQPLYLWSAAKWRAAIATIEGRFADAEKESLVAHEIGKSVEPRNADASFLTQQFALLLERGDVGHFADAATGWGLGEGFDAAFACGRAALFWAADRADAFAGEIAAIEAIGLENFPRDVSWLSALGLLAEPVSAVADARLRQTAYDLLSPFRGRVVVVGMLDTCFGSISRHLGLLATGLDLYSEADAHFAEAMAMHRKMGARPLIARTQRDWAAMLLRRAAEGDLERALPLLDAALTTARALGMDGFERKTAQLRESVVDHRQPATPDGGRAPGVLQPEAGDSRLGVCVFRRAGDLWTITFAGATVHLRDTRGMRYLAHLLAQPLRDLHVTELIGTPAAGAPHQQQVGDALLLTADLGDAGAVLDAAATAQYRHRLAALREDLVEAEANNDLGRVAALREELAFLSEQLASAGRGRRSASHAERARVAVAKGIAATIKKADAAHPAFGRHLRATIRTGYFCSYRPDPPLDWEM